MMFQKQHSYHPNGHGTPIRYLNLQSHWDVISNMCCTCPREPHVLHLKKKVIVEPCHVFIHPPTPPPPLHNPLPPLGRVIFSCFKNR